MTTGTSVSTPNPLQSLKNFDVNTIDLDINLNIEKLEPIANDNAKVKELILEFIK